MKFKKGDTVAKIDWQGDMFRDRAIKAAKDLIYRRGYTREDVRLTAGVNYVMIIAERDIDNDRSKNAS